MYAHYEGPDTLYGRCAERLYNFSSVADPDLGSGDFGPLDPDAGSGIDFYRIPNPTHGLQILDSNIYLYPGTC
jgi:hypothetical protein